MEASMPAKVLEALIAIVESAIELFPPFALARAKDAISKREDELAKIKFPELEVDKEP
mgnify:CR=1 FL=1